jgi:hypothetical protein
VAAVLLTIALILWIAGGCRQGKDLPVSNLLFLALPGLLAGWFWNSSALFHRLEVRCKDGVVDLGRAYMTDPFSPNRFVFFTGVNPHREADLKHLELFAEGIRKALAYIPDEATPVNSSKI